MARDDWGMPLPDKSSPLPWTPYGIPHLTANGYDLCTPEGDGQDAKAVEIYGSEDDCQFVVHAINNIVACREITRRLAAAVEQTRNGNPFTLGGMAASVAFDAAKLWDDMQRETKGGAK